MKVTKIDKLSRAVQKSESDKNLYSIGSPGGEDAKDFGGIFKTTLLVCFFAITFLSLYSWTAYPMDKSEYTTNQQ